MWYYYPKKGVDLLGDPMREMMIFIFPLFTLLMYVIPVVLIVLFQLNFLKYNKKEIVF